MKPLLVLLTALLFNFSYSQPNYKKGYLIKQNGDKVTCLILEEDWKYNPSSFAYKTAGTDGVQTGTLSDVKEFGVESTFKYVRKDDFLPQESLANPVFLNVLLEGNVSIYQYRSRDENIFFYKSAETNAIRELLYTDKYSEKSEYGISRNRYRSQLYTATGSDNDQLSKVRTLSYKKNDILNFVSENNSNNTTYSKFYSAAQDKYKLYLKAGAGSTPIVINNSSFGEFVDFGNDLGFRFAVELEYFFPTKSEKWSAIISPVIKHQNVEKSTTTPLEVIDDEYTYTAFEMQFGARHYFTSKTSNSRFYANAGLLVEIPLQSELTFGDEQTDVGIVNAMNLYAGIGYQYKRFGAELVYIPNLRFITTNSEFSVEFETLAFQLTYNLF